MGRFIGSPRSTEVCQLSVCSGTIASACISDARLVHTHGIWTYLSVATVRWSKSNGRVTPRPYGCFDTRNARSVGLAQFALEENHRSFVFERRHLENAACIHAFNQQKRQRSERSPKKSYLRYPELESNYTRATGLIGRRLGRRYGRWPQGLTLSWAPASKKRTEHSSPRMEGSAQTRDRLGSGDRRLGSMRTSRGIGTTRSRIEDYRFDTICGATLWRRRARLLTRMPMLSYYRR